MLHDYIEVFIDELLLSFAPARYLCRFKRQMKLQFKIDSTHSLRDSYQERLKEISHLQMELQRWESDYAALQKEYSPLKETIEDQSAHIRQLECRLNDAVWLDNTLDIRQQWLKYHIQQLNESSYGAGQCYELYETRKQEAIRAFLHRYDTLLTQDEVDRVKQETEYDENPEPYNEIDGERLTPWEIAHKLMYE